MLTDMLFICNYFCSLVKAKGKLEDIITLSAVHRMFVAIADLVLEGQRDSQK